MIRNNVLNFNQIGISCNHCVVTGNVMDQNAYAGVSGGAGAMIIGNTITGNGFAGIAGLNQPVYSNNLLTGNGAAEVQVSGTGVALGDNFCGTDTTCP